MVQGPRACYILVTNNCGKGNCHCRAIKMVNQSISGTSLV